MDAGLIELYSKYKRHPLGLAASCGGALAAHVALAASFSPSLPWNLALLSILQASATGLWILGRRLPRTRQGKIGVSIALYCESGIESQAREDFVKTLRLEVLASKAAEFQFIEIPSEQSDIVDDDAARALLNKTRSSFLIVGRVKTRTDTGGGTREFIQLLGMVRHRQVDTQRKQMLEEEFAALLPRQLDFKTHGSVYAFEFTAEWTGLVAKYIVGIAAGVSGDLDLSERLFHEVESHGAVRTRNFFLYRRLRERIPKHLLAIHHARVWREIEGWFDDHDGSRLARLGGLLDAARAKGWRNPAFIQNECFHTYLTTGDARRALKLLAQVPEERRDAIWDLNRAFLLARLGKLSKAKACYSRAASKGIPKVQRDVVVGQVESFLTWKTEKEPEAPELWFCLAAVNLLLKGDMEQAERDIERFAACCRNGQYEQEVAELRALLASAAA